MLACDQYWSGCSVGPSVAVFALPAAGFHSVLEEPTVLFSGCRATRQSPRRWSPKDHAVFAAFRVTSAYHLWSGGHVTPVSDQPPTYFAPHNSGWRSFRSAQKDSRDTK